jgi:hypothetical protein
MGFFNITAHGIAFDVEGCGWDNEFRDEEAAVAVLERRLAEIPADQFAAAVAARSDDDHDDDHDDVIDEARRAAVKEVTADWLGECRAWLEVYPRP